MKSAYRAPPQHGEAVIVPSLADAPSMIRENQRRASADKSFLSSIRVQARKQMVADAKRYCSAYRDADWIEERLGGREVEETPIIMAGHQPTLFHPGVWFKNFTLDHLAKQNGAIPVNLVIDNDVAQGSSIRVPTLSPATGHVIRETIPYDVAPGGVPHEQTVIRDESLFASFDQTVTQVVHPLIVNPCVDRLWKHARDAVSRCGVAGCALAQAQHALEGELGLQTLELPLGVLCRGSAFARFSLEIFCDLPAFVDCYNAAAYEHRLANGIRSTAHPVPNLQTRSGWCESPFWVFGNDSPSRKPVWAKKVDQWLLLTDDIDGVNSSTRTANAQTRLIAIETTHPMLAAEQLAALVTPEFKLRPRALVTTMYARLVLSDLFLHGIGGAKYDELGDVIMQRFFAVEAPQYMVVSATILLPPSAPRRSPPTGNSKGARDSREPRISREPQSMQQLSAERTRLQRAIRDSRFQPERFAGEVSLSSNLLAEKRKLLSTGERDKSWHDQMTQVNERLSDSLLAVRNRLKVELESIEEGLTSERLLRSREHPFAVFPLDYLHREYEKLLDEASTN